MNDPGLTFLDGLLWYLETRNWAFEKLTICPIGSQALDIKMYHYLYFSNLFGAVDLCVKSAKRPILRLWKTNELVWTGIAQKA
jgi:hypothetical protein